MHIKEMSNLVSFHLFTLPRVQNSKASAAVSSILSSLVAAEPFSDTSLQGLWQYVLTRPVVFDSLNVYENTLPQEAS
ncbi:hypothetical protein BKA82DRAFT_732250 [Pisolithus tinctorius]|uniref:Uncharacterized protein n=1 Tax=Pisolithus tinctorius Marx 270 TaxID=870435 RepID=A0A0C3NKD9_PISTI|nr:hypothetical protein BKA82DRAFT_732250 [Pisolithus tinctorius]KIO01390.1 hypothetical protein M404DRAFT_732250 [Pisolithus tinctorius Marx 270]